MIANYWPVWFRALLPEGRWPTSYCAIDVETSGFSHERDLVIEWGHVLVVDGKITDRLSLVIDWTDHHIVPQTWLETRMDSLRQGMVLGGKEFHHSIARMKAEGMKPDKALEFIHSFTQEIKKQGLLFVAHNGTFDEGMISQNLSNFGIATGFTFGDNGWIDTDGVEKASQCPEHVKMHPQRGDTLRSYWHRVRYARLTGVKSNLDSHCYAKYGFDKRGISKDAMHGAETDALCTHYLMEEFGKQFTVAPVPVKSSTPVAVPVRPAAKPAASAPVRQPVIMGQRVRGQRNN